MSHLSRYEISFFIGPCAEWEAEDLVDKTWVCVGSQFVAAVERVGKDWIACPACGCKNPPGARCMYAASASATGEGEA